MKKLIWLLPLGAATYLFLHFRRQKALIDQSCFKIVNAKIIKAGWQNAEIDIKVLYKNKSEIDFTVSNQKYIVLIEGNPVSTIRNDKTYKVRANDHTALWLKVKFDPSKVIDVSLKGFKEMFLGTGRLDIGIKGTIQVASGIFFSTIKVEEKTTLKELLKRDKDAEPC